MPCCKVYVSGASVHEGMCFDAVGVSGNYFDATPYLRINFIIKLGIAACYEYLNRLV